jgi:hypothetical protein
MRHRPIPRQVDKSHLIARLPRGMRPRLTGGQLVDLAIAHNNNLDLVQRGQAGEDELWHIVGGVLTWWRAVALLAAEGAAHELPDLAPQLSLAADMLERFGRTGRVLFTGPAYQLAKQGVIDMDRVAQAIDQPTASAAASWSEALTQQLADCGGTNPHAAAAAVLRHFADLQGLQSNRSNVRAKGPDTAAQE